MFSMLFAWIHRLKELLMVLFLGCAALLKVTSDSEGEESHHWLHQAFEFSEYGHIIASCVMLLLFAGSILYAVVKHWDSFRAAFQLVWKQHKHQVDHDDEEP